MNIHKYSTSFYYIFFIIPVTALITEAASKVKSRNKGSTSYVEILVVKYSCSIFVALILLLFKPPTKICNVSVCYDKISCI